ncbi:MAG TPA: hypothetical protein VMB84_06240 [Stellaceae bacterium]|nr:hypothetical protein [Stellaceae bacterium]
MKKLLAAAAVSAVALGVAGAAQAECLWAGNHWNCPGGGYIYPKTYPPDTTIANGVYSRPMYPPASDVQMATQANAAQQ